MLALVAPLATNPVQAADSAEVLALTRLFTSDLCLVVSLVEEAEKEVRVLLLLVKSLKSSAGAS
jgi:hypothetical protein